MAVAHRQSERAFQARPRLRLRYGYFLNDTGSYNFSRSAQFNAENILFIDSAALAEKYSRYIDHLISKYR